MSRARVGVTEDDDRGAGVQGQVVKRYLLSAGRGVNRLVARVGRRTHLCVIHSAAGRRGARLRWARTFLGGVALVPPSGRITRVRVRAQYENMSTLVAGAWRDKITVM